MDSGCLTVDYHSFLWLNIDSVNFKQDVRGTLVAHGDQIDILFAHYGPLLTTARRALLPLHC